MDLALHIFKQVITVIGNHPKRRRTSFKGLKLVAVYILRYCDYILKKIYKFITNEATLLSTKIKIDI
jgi:hypothetical protein